MESSVLINNVMIEILIEEMDASIVWFSRGGDANQTFAKKF